MEPKLAPKSMKNGFQEALNKKDEKWSEKSHAGVCEPGGWGPLNQFIQRPQGDQLRHSLTPLRALRGTVADTIYPMDCDGALAANLS